MPKEKIKTLKPLRKKLYKKDVSSKSDDSVSSLEDFENEVKEATPENTKGNFTSTESDETTTSEDFPEIDLRQLRSRFDRTTSHFNSDESFSKIGNSDSSSENSQEEQETRCSEESNSNHSKQKSVSDKEIDKMSEAEMLYKKANCKIVLNDKCDNQNASAKSHIGEDIVEDSSSNINNSIDVREAFEVNETKDEKQKKRKMIFSDEEVDMSDSDSEKPQDNISLRKFRKQGQNSTEIDDTKHNEKNESLNGSEEAVKTNSHNETSCITISDSSDGEKEKKSDSSGEEKEEKPLYLKLRTDLFYVDNEEKKNSTKKPKEIVEIHEISSDSDSPQTIKPDEEISKVKTVCKAQKGSSDSDDFIKVKTRSTRKKKTSSGAKPKWKSKILDSDTESDSNKTKKEQESDKDYVNDSSDPESDEKKSKKKKNQAIGGSEESSEDQRNKKKLKKRRRSSSESSNTSSESEIENKKLKRRRRIKKVTESSDSDGEGGDKNTRKTIRKVWSKDVLQDSTIAAEKDEQERKARIAERQKKYNQIFDADALLKANVEKVVLDFDEESKEDLLSVDTTLAKKLKPHQAEGVKFMWDSCFESLSRIQKHKGSGCILAHCMGLGKTLQIIALTHTLLNNSEKTSVSKVLVVCPLNTVLNWVNEFQSWLEDVDGEIDIYDMVKSKSNIDRECVVRNWSESGGVMVIGYNLFRLLTNETNKKLTKRLRLLYLSAFLDPGPDLVVCDEGHLLKNEKTNLSIAMNKIKTPRRIVLTGTPMQNNLREYYCMVQFVKPDLLGTYKEYLNRFVNPITNGQYTDSTPHDISIMKRRSHVLHSLLDGVIQRKDYGVLTPFLPPKYEYVLFIILSDVQIKLYQHYLQNRSSQLQNGGQKAGMFLFTDFQELQRICTHPRVLMHKCIQDRNKRDFEEDEDSEGSLKDFIDDEGDTSCSTSDSNNSDVKSKRKKQKKNDKRSNDDSSSSAGPSRRVTRGAVAAGVVESLDEGRNEEDLSSFSKEWWNQFTDKKGMDKIELSSKLFLLFTIIQQCEQIEDKILLFSQSLYSLDIIEYFLGKIDEATQSDKKDKMGGFSGSWSLGLDYFRLDGSSSCDNRQAWCNSFNDPENPRARLFLISTKAGGLGINLVAANRVIIFDVSWNPSHDVQSIYRVFRFGQTKPCYIYRFVCQGTMEMKIYERQVTKQAISKRVVDEQQIDRHYTQNDLTELYKFDPKPKKEKSIPLVPKDVLLGELLEKHTNLIYQYHEHQSLLENKEEEELNEEERKAAWEEFKNEKELRKKPSYLGQIPISSVQLGVSLLIKKDNPTWTNAQVQQVVPACMQQLQEQIAAGNNYLQTRVLNELRQYQMMKQQEQQQQMMMQQMYWQQVMQNPILQQQFSTMMGMSNNPPKTPVQNTSEVIELND